MLVTTTVDSDCCVLWFVCVRSLRCARFVRAYQRKVHLRKHSGETPYTCRVAGCGKKFKWRSSMSHHNKRAWPGVATL